MYIPFRFLVIVSFIIAGSSCISHKQFDYAHISSPKDLEGIYINEEKYPPKILKVEYVNNKRMVVSNFENTKWSTPVLYKGKFDKKRNTFERWISRKIYPYILILGYTYEKDRIGKDRSGNLIINNAYDATVFVFIIAGGDSYSYITKYKPLKDEVLIPYKENGKWGYKDFLSNNIKIVNTYDSVCSFQDSLARVMINQKWGLIDRSGDVVVYPKYDEVKPFEDASFEVRNDKKWGLLDSIGNESVPCIYDKISLFHRNKGGFRKIVRNGEKGVLDKDHKLILPCEYDEVYQS